MAEVRRQPAFVTRDGVTHRRHRPDYLLIIIPAVLLSLGLVVIYSISPGLSELRGVSENYYVGKQLLAIGFGAIAYAAMAFIPLETWKRLQKPLIVTALIATLIALIMPASPEYPAHRWIRLGSFSFQSVELIKFAIIFSLSAFLAARMRRGEVRDVHKTLRPVGIVVALIGVVVVVLQSDLGSAGVMLVMIGVMCAVAGMPLQRVLLLAGVIGIGVILAVSTTAYRRERLATFLNPTRDCQASGYQACQALIAVGSGGVFGKGIGHSVQAYGYTPEPANDSIFAIYAEKFGFVGSAALLTLFVALFARIKNIVERAPDDYARLVVLGVLMWLSVQTVMNIGAMVGVLPLKGITLPLVSYGGTSIVFVMAAIGLVFNVSRYTSYAPRTETDGDGYDHSADRRRDRRAHYAPASGRSRA